MLAVVFTLAIFAQAETSAQTETSAIDLISYQVREDENGAFSLRLITGVDSLDYGYCGYRVEVTMRNAAGNDVTTTRAGRDSRVYSSIFGGQTEYAVSEISDYPYAILATVTGLKTTSSYIRLAIQPFAVTFEGERVYGKTAALVYTGESDDEGYPVFASVSADAAAPRHEIVLDPEMQSTLGTYLPDSWQEVIPNLSIKDADTFAFAMQTDTHYTIYNNTTQNTMKSSGR